MPPLVSVIMPFRNMARYMEASIRSVLAQTREEWELLLVDDGSLDESLQIARKYQDLDPERIRVLTYGDDLPRGASAARNFGLTHAQGSILGLLDADDLWLPDAIEHGAGLLDTYPTVDVVYGRTYWWYSWQGESAAGRNRPRDFLEHSGVRPGTPIEGARLWERCLRNAAAVPSTISMFMRGDAVARSGGFEESFTRVYTDQVFYSKLFLGSRVLPSNRCWAWYRRRSDSSSALSRDEEREMRRAFLSWLERYLRDLDHDDRKLSRTVQDELYWLDRPAALQRVRRLIQRIPGRIDRLLAASAASRSPET